MILIWDMICLTAQFPIVNFNGCNYPKESELLFSLMSHNTGPFQEHWISGITP